MHPQTKTPVKVREDYRLVTPTAAKVNQGNKSHKRLEPTIIHQFNTYSTKTATMANPFTDDKQADILLSGITTIDNPAARNLYLDCHVYQPYWGHPNQNFINRATVLTSAKEKRKHDKYDAICAATGSHFSPLARETTGGHGASTATVYFLFAKQLRDLGLPADVLVGKLKKDISFALRRGTIAQGTTALDAAQLAVEDE